MSVLISIGEAVPSFEHFQKDIAQFMINYLELDENKTRLLNAIYHNSAIEKRYSVLPDFSSPGDLQSFFAKSENRNSPDIEKRLECFQKNALPLSLKAIEDCFSECLSEKISIDNVTHLITVSCTGMSAPGLEIDLINSLDVSSHIGRTGINFMGCYAVFHALKIADALCKADANAVVLIVSVELCTLHFQNKSDMDNLVANSLFGDGAAAALICSDKKAKESSLKGLFLNNFFSDIVSGGKKDMAWRISSSGFLMTLSSYIPNLVEQEIGPLAKKAIKQSSLENSDIDHYAIHPGGRKILEAVAKSLKIESRKMDESFEVLKNYGNMSSVTILFVLKQIWNKKADWGKKQNIFAVSFGPGLTLESAMLQTVNYSMSNSRKLKHSELFEPSFSSTNA